MTAARSKFKKHHSFLVYFSTSHRFVRPVFSVINTFFSERRYFFRKSCISVLWRFQNGFLLSNGFTLFNNTWRMTIFVIKMLLSKGNLYFFIVSPRIGGMEKHYSCRSEKKMAACFWKLNYEVRNEEKTATKLMKWELKLNNDRYS